MNKAFIFDLDGVLIDDEQTWQDEKAILFSRLFGPEVTAKMGSTLGINLDGIIDLAVKHGAKVDRNEVKDEVFKTAIKIYETSPIPEGTSDLILGLKKLGFRLAVVSASPLSWVTTALHRLPVEDDFELVLSLYERADLAHKPAPDGYLEALKVLGSDGGGALALEDSNPGIASAKAARIYTIGYEGNLTRGYEQVGADTYAKTMDEVFQIAKQFIK